MVMLVDGDGMIVGKPSSQVPVCLFTLLRSITLVHR